MLMLFIFVIISMALGGHCSFTTDEKYCNKSMCPHQGPHVACGKTKDFGPACQGLPKQRDLKELQSLILHEHNKCRSRVAAGNAKCLYSARRMPVLYWDDELAETAGYNARSCVFAHDACRSTSKYPMAGQNIYMTRTKRVNLKLVDFIKEAICMWDDEQQYANNSLMASFHKTVPQTGHFTLLCCDRSNRVGCAFVDYFLAANPDIYDDKDRLYVLFVCNYSSTNIKNYPSYKAGPPASDCIKKSTTYKALCEDPIDPNDLQWSRSP